VVCQATPRGITRRYWRPYRGDFWDGHAGRISRVEIVFDHHRVFDARDDAHRPAASCAGLDADADADADADVRLGFS